LVLAAIVLLIASRSRADRADERETRKLETKKQEPIKDKPVTSSRRDATLAGGAAAAGSTAVAAMAKEPSAKATAPAKEPEKTEEVKEIEPVAPAIGMERIGTEVKNLLDGKDYDEAVIASNNTDTRQIVSTELLAALASRNPERRLRAREAFTRHGFFDEATQKLRTSTTPAERISAARALGLTQDQAATPHLVAALEDDDPEVRRASVNALAELRDPSAIGPLNALLEREKNRKVPHSLIRRAIEASATIDLPETPTVASSATPATPPAAPDADKKDKDDDDREVFEI
jgi:HEAT repeat protein